MYMYMYIHIFVCMYIYISNYKGVHIHFHLQGDPAKISQGLGLVIRSHQSKKGSRTLTETNKTID